MHVSAGASTVNLSNRADARAGCAVGAEDLLPSMPKNVFRFMHGRLLPPAPLLKLAAPPVAIGCVTNMSRRRWSFDSVAAQKYVFESDPAMMYVSLPRQSSQQVTEESTRKEWCRDMAHIF